MTSLRRHSITTFIAAFGLFGGLAFWGSTVEVDGAVVASGEITVGVEARDIQHETGGKIDQVMVKDGDKVRAGDVLFKLKNRDLATKSDEVRTALDEAMIDRARLEATSNGRGTLTVPDALQSRTGEKNISAALTRSNALILAEKTGSSSHLEGLEAQADQGRLVLSGYKGELAVIAAKLRDLVTQIAEAKKATPAPLPTLLSALQSQRLELVAEQDSLNQNLKSGKNGIDQINAQIDEANASRDSQTLEKLGEADQKVIQLKAEQKAAAEQINSLKVRAPIDGVVQETTPVGKGTVVGPGVAAMRIVPLIGEINAKVRVSPTDIDKVSPQMTVLIRFSGLDQRSTPEVKGKVQNISAEPMRDQVTGAQFYVARALIPKNEAERLGRNVIMTSGMPVDVHLRTGKRSVVSFLVKPVSDQLKQAFAAD